MKQADRIEIDGSHGEGGGQILRTALGLSLVTGRSVRLFNIRVRRTKPGLQRQHVTAVHAAATVGNAQVAGAAVGSQDLTFDPGPVAAGDWHLSIGSAGSTTLVVQTVLPALLSCDRVSKLTLEGGTHNPLAPPVDFLTRVFLPLINRMGAHVELRLVRHGFYPAGGGQIEVRIEPPKRLLPIEIVERGALVRGAARALVSRLPRSIAERELAVVHAELGWPKGALNAVEITDSPGPGNVLMLELEFEHARELVVSFGERGKPAEKVAAEAVAEAKTFLGGDVPVGEYLADQLMAPLALAGGGRFRTFPLSSHAVTNIQVIERFLDVRFEVQTTALASDVTVHRL